MSHQHHVVLFLLAPRFFQCVLPFALPAFLRLSLTRSCLTWPNLNQQCKPSVLSFPCFHMLSCFCFPL
ncbi:hypothetical protein BCR44DRAFT_1438771 [Catenaria anguillulae PL171]|uniref:Uncharacterized protein n=1 Tax=Catenaria anguillulae PL171 TaxID=765915 RepID=A0A1Y2HGV0_9FUNG|nr:hypothetical protein BCR44DRAFT_1438771 [Catenaria anguillulae PL171]